MASKKTSEKREPVIRHKAAWQENRDEDGDEEDYPTVDEMHRQGAKAVDDLSDTFTPEDAPKEQAGPPEDSFFHRVMGAGKDAVQSFSDRVKPALNKGSEIVNDAGKQFNKNLEPQAAEMKADIDRNSHPGSGMTTPDDGSENFIDRARKHIRVTPGFPFPSFSTDLTLKGGVGLPTIGVEDQGPPRSAMMKDSPAAAPAAADTKTSTSTPDQETAPTNTKVSVSSKHTGGSGGGGGKPGKSLVDQITEELNKPGATAVPAQWVPDPAARAAYDAELAEAKQDYKDAKSDLDRRESIEAFANAIGRIGAGFAGLGTGTDMSKVEFGKQDWDKKRAQASDDNKTTLAQMGEKRRQQAVEDQFGAKYNQDNQQHADKMNSDEKKTRVSAILDANKDDETARHDRATEQNDALKNSLGIDNQFLRQELTAIKDSQTQSTAQQKKLKDARISIGKIMGSKQLDEDTKVEQLKDVFVNELDVTPEKAHSLVMKDGWIWGENLRDPDELYRGLQDISAASALDKSLVTVTKDGVQKRVNKPDAVRLARFGWK